MTPDDDLAVERALRLMEAVPATPMPWELAVLARAVALASTRISLPPRLPVHWRHIPDDSDAAPGACDGSGPEPIVYLGVAPRVSRDALAATALHELQHAADYFAGREFERSDFEERAETFSRTMMEFWRAGVRPATSPSTSTTRASTIPKPKSLGPNPCEARARYLSAELMRRLQRLRRKLDGEGGRALSVVMAQADELCDIAIRKETDGV